jgi:hypothetical protein
MTEYITIIKDWLIALGEKHEVDPLLLGCLYLVSKVCFVTCLGWVIKNLRAKKPIMVPLLLASVSFSMPYLYLIIAGRNIPVWVYVLIIFMFSYGGYTIWKKVTIRPESLNS